jgi:hypothetical protein
MGEADWQPAWAWREALRDGAEIMLWSGERGTLYDEGHMWRIEWSSRVGHWSKWALLERLEGGSVVLV